MERGYIKDNDKDVHLENNAFEEFPTENKHPDNRQGKQLQIEENGTNMASRGRQYKQYDVEQSYFANSDSIKEGCRDDMKFGGCDHAETYQGKCSQRGRYLRGENPGITKSHKRVREEQSRDYARRSRGQNNPDNFYPADTQNATHKNPTYEYSVKQDVRMSPCCQRYKTLQQNPPDQTQLPSCLGSSDGQHREWTGSGTHTSRSPVSLPSPESSKSNPQRQVDTSSTGTSRSQLPLGLNKTSTPYKVQQTSQAPLPTGMEASGSKTCTPIRFPSHNTSMLSESVVCRICHDGDRSEVLISPCYCAGSMGLLHVSCLQRWLGSSNKTSCEICNFQFALQKKSMPISQFLKEPGTSRDKKNLICDLVSFLLITPLTFIVIGICIYGATHHYADRKMEQGGLIGLAISLVLLYMVWLAVAVRHNWRLWQDWKMFHQEVTLLCTPCVPGKQPSAHTPDAPGSESFASRSTLGSIHLQSIKISVKGPMARYKGQRLRKETQPTERTQRTPEHITQDQRVSDNTSDGSQKIQGQFRQPVAPEGQVVTHSYPYQHQGHSGQFQGEGRVSRDLVTDRQCNIDSMNERDRYYNTKERYNDNTKQMRKDTSSQPSSCYDRQSRYSVKYSSDCSSHPSEDNRQGKRFRSDLTKQGPVREKKVYYNDGWHSNLARMPLSEKQKYKKRMNTYKNTESRPSGSAQGNQRQENIGETLDIFSRGGSPPEDEKSHDNVPYDDFVTKWINDQTKVLVRENQRSPNPGSSNPCGLKDVDERDIPDRRIQEKPGPLQSLGADKDTEKDHERIRIPPALSITSSEASCVQTIRENIL